MVKLGTKSVGTKDSKDSKDILTSVYVNVTEKMHLWRGDTRIALSDLFIY